eukprot:gene17545-biopygen12888
MFQNSPPGVNEWKDSIYPVLYRTSASSKASMCTREGRPAQPASATERTPERGGSPRLSPRCTAACPSTPCGEDAP